MGWFGKKNGKKKEVPSLPSFPQLPELPKLPDKRADGGDDFRGLPDVSAYNDDKFSDNSDGVKRAVSGEMENEDFGNFSDDENSFGDNLQGTYPDETGNEGPMQAQSLPPASMSKESAPEDFNSSPPFSRPYNDADTGQNSGRGSSPMPPVPVHENGPVKEPIFVRIDRFREGLESFRKIKSQVHKIEKMLSNTKEIKKQEQKEMESWDEQLKSIKERLEGLDREIFSKV